MLVINETQLLNNVLELWSLSSTNTPTHSHVLYGEESQQVLFQSYSSTEEKLKEADRREVNTWKENNE